MAKRLHLTAEDMRDLLDGHTVNVITIDSVEINVSADQPAKEN